MPQNTDLAVLLKIGSKVKAFSEGGQGSSGPGALSATSKRPSSARFSRSDHSQQREEQGS